MRKLIAILVASAMVCAFAPLVGAGGTDTINVTLTPSGAASINVYAKGQTPITAATWDGAGANIGAVGTSDVDAYNCTSNGTVPVDVTVKIASADDGAVWNLGTAPGHNTYNMSFTKGAGYTLIDDPGVNFVLGLGYQSTQTFGLKVYMPTSSSTTQAQTVIITFTATAAA